MAGFSIAGMFLIFLISFLFISVCYRSYSQLRRKPLAGSTTTPAERLQRIQKAGWWLQLLMVISFLVVGYALLAFFMGWPFFSEQKVRIVVSQNHIYTSPADIPGEVLGWWLIRMAWSGFGYWVMFSLFGLYRRGILFSAKNVLRIRLLGYFLIGNWGLDDQLQTALHDVQLSTTPVFVGLLIIFVSWIMDEGRKMQEEQELTV